MYNNLFIYCILAVNSIKNILGEPRKTNVHSALDLHEKLGCDILYGFVAWQTLIKHTTSAKENLL